jgi:hypothetical protein
MLRTLALLLFLLSASVSAAEVRIGARSLDWFDGFTQSTNSEPVRLTGPDGVVVLVSAYRVKDEAVARGGVSDIERYVAFAQNQLPKLASKAGTVVVPLVRDDLLNGMILFSTAARTSSLFSSGFYLQYFLITPHGRVALFTVEGKGDALAEHERYRPLFNTAQWP